MTRWIKSFVPRKIKESIVRQKCYQSHFADGTPISPFRFEGSNIRKDTEDRYQYNGDLLDIYTKGSLQLVRK